MPHHAPRSLGTFLRARLRVVLSALTALIVASAVPATGEAGARIHLGRSRNDQVLTALRLYLRDATEDLAAGAEAAAVALDALADRQGEVALPGYTHMQPAMPSSVGLWARGFAAESVAAFDEDALCEHPAVEEATVVGIKDDYRGEAPKAFVKLRSGSKVTVDDFKKHLETRISKIEMPAEIEIRDQLPKTMIGKLSKKELKAEEEARRKRK